MGVLTVTSLLIRAVLGATAAAAFLAGQAGAQASLEYPVKATYLYKFAPFVEWPQAAFESPASPFVICIAGPDPFGTVLEQAVVSQRVGARPIAVKRLPRGDRSAGCHVMYIGARSGPAAEALAAVRGAPVLTVTDSSRGGGPRGVIDFVVQQNKVRFQIDEQAARQNGLSISSKLLSLAVAVKPRS